MTLKKTLFTILIIILLGIGIVYYINSQAQVLQQPLLSQEEEQDLLLEDEETEPEEEEETFAVVEEETDEEESFTERLTLVIQETMGRIFQREVNIVAIGDSLTRGVGDETGRNGYVGILERSLNQEREVANFENFGVPGNRTDHLLERLDEPEIVYALHEADLVLLTIGANDIMRVARENLMNLEIGDFMEERDLYEERLEEILFTIQEENEDAAIYLLGLYNPFEQYFEDIEELNQIVDAWNDTAIDLAEELENVTFIPMADLFADQDEPVFADDNFHPSYTGYYLMAERVLDYISEEEG